MKILKLRDREKLEKLYQELYESIVKHFEFMFQEMKAEKKADEEDRKAFMFVAKTIFNDYKDETERYIKETYGEDIKEKYE